MVERKHQVKLVKALSGLHQSLNVKFQLSNCPVSPKENACDVHDQESYENYQKKEEPYDEVSQLKYVKYFFLTKIKV